MRLQLLAGAALSAAAIAVTAPASYAAPDCPDADCTVRIVSPLDGETLPTGLPKFAGIAEPGASVELIANFERSTVTADANGRWTWFPAAPLGEGSQRIAARSAGKTSEILLNIDSLPPAIEIQSPQANAVRTAVNLIARGQIELGATLELTLDDQRIEATIDAEGRWVHIGASALADGTHVLIAKARDSAGNVSAQKTAFRVDRNAPAINITSPLPGFYKDSPRGLAGVGEPGSTVRVVGPSLDAQLVVPANGRWHVDVANLPDGHHHFRVVATDSVGWSADDRIELIVDSVPPALAVSTDLDKPLADALVRFRGVAEPGVHITVETEAGVIGEDQVPATGRWEVVGYEPLLDGLHGILITATDRAGNATWMMTSAIVDTIAPVLQLSELFEGDNGQVSLTGFAEPRSMVDVLVAGEVLAMTTADATGQWRAEVQVAETGSIDLEIVAVDVAGNTSETRHRMNRSTETTDGPDAGCSGGGNGLTMGFALLALLGLVTLRRTSTAGTKV